MTEMLATCTTTKQQFSAGIVTDAQSLQKSWKKVLKVNCPHCGEIHEVSVREAYLKGMEDLATWAA